MKEVVLNLWEVEIDWYDRDDRVYVHYVTIVRFLAGSSRDAIKAAEAWIGSTWEDTDCKERTLARWESKEIQGPVSKKYELLNPRVSSLRQLDTITYYGY